MAFYVPAFPVKQHIPGRSIAFFSHHPEAVPAADSDTTHGRRNQVMVSSETRLPGLAGGPGHPPALASPPSVCLQE